MTARFVSMHLDEGQIIWQGSCGIKPTKSSKDIVAAGRASEARVLVEAIKLYLAKRLEVYWGTVKQV